MPVSFPTGVPTPIKATAALLLLALSACNSMTTDTAHEGIGFRQARHAEITAMREYRSCRDDAFALDRQAREEVAPARYLASARLLERCEADLGPEAAGLAEEERMRAYALAVQNYFKGGDLIAARRTLEAFKSSFAGRDLYFADGASFVESMDLLLGVQDRSVIGEFAVANVNSEMKAELRRLRYWKRN